MTNTTNNDHEDGAAIWECPCSHCTELDWMALGDSPDRPTLAQYRNEQWGDLWPIEPTRFQLWLVKQTGVSVAKQQAMSDDLWMATFGRLSAEYKETA